MKNFLTQEATLYGKSGYDKFGNQSFGISKKIKCKFVESVNHKADAIAEELQSNAIAYVDINTKVDAEYKIVYNAVEYEIQRVLTQRGTATTLKHKKLYLKRFVV